MNGVDDMCLSLIGINMPRLWIWIRISILCADSQEMHGREPWASAFPTTHNRELALAHALWQQVQQRKLHLIDADGNHKLCDRAAAST